MHDPFSRAIAEAVDAAIEARIPHIVEALKAVTQAPKSKSSDVDRFFPMRALTDEILRPFARSSSGTARATATPASR